MLIGVIPLARSVPLGGGRHLHLDANSLDDWVLDLQVLPVLVEHDPDRLVGWVDRAKLHHEKLLLYGDLDPTFDPHARTAGRLITTHVRNGLSPRVATSIGDRRWGDGSWRPGPIHQLTEVSIGWEPRIPNARWVAA
jgi:hypothetical protein